MPIEVVEGAAVLDLSGDDNFHIGVAQERVDGANNDAGGVIPFAASGGIETAKLIYDPEHYTTSNIHVSEQQQVDCVTTSYGCEGGWSEDSFKVATSVGFTNGQAYQYTGTTDNCKRRGGEFKIYDYEHYKMTCE